LQNRKVRGGREGGQKRKDGRKHETIKVKRDTLREAVAGILEGGGGLFVTMSPGQWDALLSTAYDTGATLLEIDDKEQPVKAYQRRIEA